MSQTIEQHLVRILERLLEKNRVKWTAKQEQAYQEILHLIYT